ncbi:MAG: cytochrome c3 family protein [Candidatus Acidiferrales bacterium]
MRRERMLRGTRLSTGALAGMLLFALLPLQARQSAASEAKKDVPDNLAEHTPPSQPIPYSHQTHLMLGLECQSCHANPEPGKLMTYPATSTCMSCHDTVSTEKPAIQKLAAYAKSGQPVPWVRVYQVTVGVNWTHRKHLAAGVKCETCHGDVADMPAMSMATGVTSMGVCINCHKLHNAPTVCETCHSWPSE